MNECKTCEKQTFYNKREFIRAHGKPHIAPNFWELKTIQPDKKEPIFVYLWVCKSCKQETHTKTCKHYTSPKPITIQREIFNWEVYWKQWFGVLTLDLNSNRFFGGYKF